MMTIEREGLKRVRPMLDLFIQKLKPIYGDALKKGNHAKKKEGLSDAFFSPHDRRAARWRPSHE